MLTGDVQERGVVDISDLSWFPVNASQRPGDIVFRAFSPEHDHVSEYVGYNPRIRNSAVA